MQNAINPDKKVEYLKRDAGRLLSRFFIHQASIEAVDGFLREHGTECEVLGQRRAVVVFDVDHSVYEERIRSRGAQPIQTPMVFPSAAAASAHFGYVNNAVAHALFRGKARSAEIVVVAGARVGYLDEIKGVN